MGSVDRRIEDLERRFSETTKPESSLALTHLKIILNEIAYLKQSCAERWTGHRNQTRVEGENIPRKILGPGYTHRQLLELAVERAVEDGGVPVERSQGYLEYLCGLSGEPLDTVGQVGAGTCLGVG
jgi:hypothetical protein